MSTKKRQSRRRERQTDAPRRHRVNVAYNDNELAALTMAATAAGMAVSAYVAQAALAVAREEISPAPVEEKSQWRELRDAVIAVNRIGTNWNQIAHVKNAGGDVPDPQFNAVRARVDEAVSRLHDATVTLVQQMKGG
ncbi:plasmid mobilization protein [Streptomyces sp. HUAS TT7]|uniref:plasmid mobilization protein n=1 Tax=Streptomyces sp. HUAS TT7 TaxID=3447507 RepID=UPI003F6593DD